MEDSEILDLYCQRNENAIAETEKKYGRYCFSVANNVLHCKEDAEECVNDTWMRVWENIPPQRPERFLPFLGKITHRLALDRFRGQNAEKRGQGETALSFSELEECIPAGESGEERLENLIKVLDEVLGRMKEAERKIFVRRYFYMDSVADIAAKFGYGESKVKMILSRGREKLRKALEKEEIFL